MTNPPQPCHAQDRKAALAESLGQGSAPAPPPARLPLQAIALGTSADLLVGQKVYAIGNPFGLGERLHALAAVAWDPLCQVH